MTDERIKAIRKAAHAAVDNPPFGVNLASVSYVSGLLAAIEILENEPGDPHYPEHAWVWTDGNYFDAVVIHREWAAYQRMYMEAQPGYWAAAVSTEPRGDTQ